MDLGGISVLMIAVAIYVRVFGTSAWVVRGLAGLLALQLVGFILVFDANAFQFNSEHFGIIITM